MRAILISIRPEWVAKILSGEKTLEIRKTAPKCDLPIDVYIYCTQSKPYVAYINGKLYTQSDGTGKGPAGICLNGKVVAKFTMWATDEFIKGLNDLQRYCLDELDEEPAHTPYKVVLKKACLTDEEAERYCPDQSFCAWFIDDLEIFDEPKDLSDFFSLPETYHHDHESMVDYYERKEARRLKRAPQSWQYVEVQR